MRNSRTNTRIPRSVRNAKVVGVSRGNRPDNPPEVRDARPSMNIPVTLDEISVTGVFGVDL